jgi:hypothetical protein
MESAVFISNSKSNLALLLNLAKKLGISTHRLSPEEIEEMALVNAMKKGKTGEYVDTEKYLKKIQSK